MVTKILKNNKNITFHFQITHLYFLIMSWWDTKQLTSFASNALKTAQKKIDKVLDIKEDEKGRLLIKP